MAAILLYHVFPINHWEQVTDLLFQKLPFQRIVVHVSLPKDELTTVEEVEGYFKKYPVDEILFSFNSGKGEVDAMRRFVQSQDLSAFDILTYMHSKGVSKPGNEHIRDWTKLMRFFIIEKMNICRRVFKKGYVTFGCNRTVPVPNEGFHGSNFFYEGNFVSLNLRKVNLQEAVDRHLENSYYGLEGFWGKLCSYEEGYSIFNSGINHYLMPIAEKEYATSFARFRYRLVKRFYTMKTGLWLKEVLLNE